MRVLLVNPNRFQAPPAPPIGLELIAGALESRGHETAIADLCFAPPGCGDLDRAIEDFSPNIVGVTIRNIDTVLYQRNQFFLPGIEEIVRRIKIKFGLKVVVGGAGIAADPESVLNYVGADYAVCGPGEEPLCRLLEALGKGQGAERVISGRTSEISCPRRRSGVDYRKYLASGGVAGFETHKGCSSSCCYCLEANTRVSFKRIDEVIEEIRDFVLTGVSRFHLCDSEFNEDLDYALDFCGRLRKSGLEIDWAVYMKPATYNKKLFRLMKETGVSLITLTVDTWKKCPLYWSDIEKIIYMAKSNDIKLCVDMLAGFPYEDEDTLAFSLDLFRRAGPDGVGVNTYLRLYKTLPITKIVLGDEALKPYLKGEAGDPSLIRPVFYNHLEPEKLERMIGSDPTFRIEGLEDGVNYLRMRNAGRH